MAFPPFDKFFRPVLEAHRHGERHLRELSQEIEKYFNLTEKQKQELIPTGNKTKLYDRICWAKTYLTNAGLLKMTRRSYSEITPLGLQILESRDEINSKYLKQFDPFKEFKGHRSEEPNNQNKDLEIVDEQDGTPEEIFERNIKTVNETLAQELLTRVHAETPKFFENLIINLLIAMGYGGREGIGNTIGKPGDGGVDGIIDQDVLGLDKIYCQAKRYAPENKVSGGDIRDFSGALNLHGVTKGIFVTTSSFTRDAQDTAEKLNQNIILINGRELAELMIRYNIGCQVEKTYEFKKINEDYFDLIG